ncbi:protein phosphatase 2C domain-containing protein [Billgrantia gudaonensis]|uniref:Protein phosphatase 2C n=1 Tax=Billgrantia gudaonensis TaxID=376427 RepID=A0A1G8RXZ5_9GAMM|nr:protein phosphatase 2C domain-containing protein [Halomonas gudaonensis]SDJ21874.1 Protein phosphatase 2C [Halomonas gudaonensis]
MCVDRRQPCLDDTKDGWHSLAVAVAGLAHLETEPAVPCQDAALATVSPRPLLVLADGAGSAAASEQGAQTVTGALRRLLVTLESQVAPLLDTTEPPDDDACRDLARLMVRHAQGVLADAAQAQRREVRDLRCTLLMAAVGRARLLWLKVGDGAIVVEQAEPDPQAETLEEPVLMPVLSLLGESGRGEFANQTTFVDERLTFDEVQSGCCDMEGVTGIALMSDGAAEKLVAHDGSRVAGQLSHWLDDLRGGRLRERQLVRRFYSEAFCRGTAGDDRAIALAARELFD